MHGRNLFAAAPTRTTTDAQPVVRNDPPGITTNNPGNLETLPRGEWRGQIGTRAVQGRVRGFAIFDTPENGLRALGVNIISQQRLHGRNTVGGLIERFAPATDGNPTAGYAGFVARYIGVGVNDEVDFTDPEILQQTIEAIIMFENGAEYAQHYTRQQIEAGVNSAIDYHQDR